MSRFNQAQIQEAARRASTVAQAMPKKKGWFTKALNNLPTLAAGRKCVGSLNKF